MAIQLITRILISTIKLPNFPQSGCNITGVVKNPLKPTAVLWSRRIGGFINITLRNVYTVVLCLQSFHLWVLWPPYTLEAMIALFVTVRNYFLVVACAIYAGIRHRTPDTTRTRKLRQNTLTIIILQCIIICYSRNVMVIEVSIFHSADRVSYLRHSKGRSLHIHIQHYFIAITRSLFIKRNRNVF